ncbi:MAG TPA: DUF4157 domain-containing protein [Pyrinomonadaceae bacterium]|jgi:hypothetical protein|nr:DUF4157 domain-containing protein [Pyrinomonadaceae bacterium]
MDIFASSIRSAENKKEYHPAYGRKPEEIAPLPYTPASSGLSIQRKASCACGGGCPSCQAKSSNLSISQPDDAYEKEADGMADKVMRMETPGSSRLSPIKNSVQRKKIQSDSISFASPIVPDALSTDGKPLDADTRAYMEPRFNYDFSNVRIHDNDQAAKSASSVNALAYTSGNHVVFNSGQYNTNSDSGKRLLAHELTHVVQQRPERISQPDSDNISYGGPITHSAQDQIARKVIWKDITNLPGDLMLILDVDDGDFVGGCVKAYVPHVGAKLIKKSPHTQLFNVHIGVTTNKLGQMCVFFYESVSRFCEMKCYASRQELEESMEEIKEWIKEKLGQVLEALAILALILIASYLIYLIAEAIMAALVLVLALVLA